MARVRMSAEDRRVEILRAAGQAIEEHGVAALRMADVAKAINTSPALVVYHFETKENLVAAAFAHAAEADLLHLKQLVSAPGGARDRLRAAIRWYSPTGKAKGWRLWIEGWAVALHEAPLREVSANLDRQWRSVLSDVIREGVRVGEFDCPDPESAVGRLTALLDGLAVQVTVHPGAVPQKTMQDWIDRTLLEELGPEA